MVEYAFEFLVKRGSAPSVGAMVKTRRRMKAMLTQRGERKATPLRLERVGLTDMYDQCWLRFEAK